MEGDSTKAMLTKERVKEALALAEEDERAQRKKA